MTTKTAPNHHRAAPKSKSLNPRAEQSISGVQVLQQLDKRASTPVATATQGETENLVIAKHNQAGRLVSSPGGLAASEGDAELTALIKLRESLPAATDRQKTFEGALLAIKALNETPLPLDLTGLAEAHNANSTMMQTVINLIGTLDHTTPAMEWELFETLCIRGRRILATASRSDCHDENDIRIFNAFATKWHPQYERNADRSHIAFIGDGEYVLEGRGRCHVTATDEFIDSQRLYLIEPRILERRFWFQEYAMEGELVGKFA